MKEEILLSENFSFFDFKTFNNVSLSYAYMWFLDMCFILYRKTFSHII